MRRAGPAWAELLALRSLPAACVDKPGQDWGSVGSHGLHLLLEPALLLSRDSNRRAGAEERSGWLQSLTNTPAFNSSFCHVGQNSPCSSRGSPGRVVPLQLGLFSLPPFFASNWFSVTSLVYRAHQMCQSFC